MKAAVYDRYGGVEVLSVREVPDPVPARGEVLVRVKAAALNPKDVLVRKGKFRTVTGDRFPQRTGYDWAGEVLSGPSGDPALAPGRRLFGMVQSWRAGACAEILAAKPDECGPIPEGLSFEEAAALPLAAQTALQAIRDVGRAGSGSRLLLNGASGGVGTLAIQIGKALGLHVTAVTSARNLDLVRSLGADEALDYGAVDPLKEREAYDTIFDVYGNRSFASARRALRPRGTYVTTVPGRRIVLDTLGTFASAAFGAVSFRSAARRARLVVVRSRRGDLLEIARMVEAGKLRPVLDRVLPLAEIAAGHAHLETRRARGKVVLTV